MLRIPVWAYPVSLAATPGIEFSFFSSSYLDVSVHWVPSAWLWIHHAVTEVCSAGFPHSDICGSMPVCSSPQLFAAYHVLLRPLVPRHPPRAFCCLTIAYFTPGTFYAMYVVYAFSPFLRLAWRYFRSFVFCHSLFSESWHGMLFSIPSFSRMSFLSRLADF